MFAALALLMLAAAGLVAWWLPSDAEMASRLQTEFEQRFGIALTVDRVHWALRPVPVVVLDGIATAQARPITVRRIAVRPQLRALWNRRIAIDSIDIDGALLPRDSVRAFRGRYKGAMAQTTTATGNGWALAELPVKHVQFTDVTWIDRRDIALAYEGDVDFDPAWRPRRAEVRRAKVEPMARLRLEREDVRDGDADRWRTLIDLGGGTWNGTTTLDTGGKAGLSLHAELEAVNVDITQLVSSFGRRSAVQGKLQGRTDIDASGEDPAVMLRSLHTRTRFAVKPATLLRFDLAKAVRTVGMQRDGQTVLEELTGTLDTQATNDGVLLHYTGLRARSGLLTATGSARVLNRKLDGDVAVDLVDGVVGVPLKLGGTLDAPQLSLTGAALTGAAIGTAVLPGVGTAIGARIGQKVEQLFGGKPKRRP